MTLKPIDLLIQQQWFWHLFCREGGGGVKTAKIEITVMHFQVGYKIGCQIIHAVIEHK